MSFLTKDDYAKENRKYQGRKDATITNKKTKLPTQLKSKPVYCRNCNCKNKRGNENCTQCDIVLKNPLERPMK